MADDAARYVRIYLNDHLAGSTTAIELIGRATGEHEGTEIGAFLAGLRKEIEADRDTLKAAMAEHGVAIQRPKLVAAWVAEKAGRLKFNGHLLRRSPLTPFVELETLAVGIHGKLLLWRALQAAGWDAAAGTPLDDLVARAERQHDAVERHRRVAARDALSGARAR
jgi:hypothetical protein